MARRAHRAGLLFLYLSVWLVTFVLKRRGTVATEVKGYGQPQTTCGTSYWAPGNGCGLDYAPHPVPCR